MSDAETGALGRAAVLLLVASLARWAWAPDGGPVVAGGEGEALPTLMAETRARTDEARERSRPLGEGERLDPNAASEAELDRLPGVGAATARALVESRTEEGPFPTLESLARVRGVGPALLERIRPHLALDPAPGGRAPPPRARDTKVDVNRADTLTLQALPGVGPALARRIVLARRDRPFASVDDLVRVRGIGPATVERLRPLVSAGR